MEDITLTRGFMTDLDPYHFREGGPLGIQADLSPTEFYERHLHEWLERSAFWKNAEVICTGNGLALIQRFEQPLLCSSIIDVQRFDLQVKLVHTSLPSDPDQGGVCQTPRVPGSINTKNGNDRPVVLLVKGTPISYPQFIEFTERMAKEPMTVILETLFGKQQISPCPLCGQKDSRLASVHKGRLAKCNRCGEFSMGKFYRKILKDREQVMPSEEVRP